jgi:hypothetical protein
MPGHLPIMQAAKFESAIDLETARTLGAEQSTVTRHGNRTVAEISVSHLSGARQCT